MTTDRPIPTVTSTVTVPVTFAEIAQLPVMVDLLTAARVLGIGRTTAYTLAREGEFPCPVVRVGGAYKVPVLGLVRLLGIELGTDSTGGGVDSTGHRSESGAKSVGVALPRDPPAARA